MRKIVTPESVGFEVTLPVICGRSKLELQDKTDDLLRDLRRHVLSEELECRLFDT